MKTRASSWRGVHLCDEARISAHLREDICIFSKMRFHVKFAYPILWNRRTIDFLAGTTLIPTKSTVGPWRLSWWRFWWWRFAWCRDLHGDASSWVHHHEEACILVTRLASPRIFEKMYASSGRCGFMQCLPIPIIWDKGTVHFLVISCFTMFGAFLAVIGWDIRPNFKENLKPCAQLYASECYYKQRYLYIQDIIDYDEEQRATN